MRKQGWVRVKAGKDRRERLFSLTGAGRRQMVMAQPYWEQAERRLRTELGDAGWKYMKETVLPMTEAAMQA
jgi:DNA-binding MarR family transcriptional regulator